MKALLISPSLGNLALGCSNVQATLQWPIAQNPIPGGEQPKYIKIDNTNNSTVVYVRVAPTTDTIVTPGSNTVGNCIPLMPLGSLIIQVIPDHCNAETSPFNDGSGELAIDTITTDGSAIIVVSPVQII